MRRVPSSLIAMATVALSWSLFACTASDEGGEIPDTTATSEGGDTAADNTGDDGIETGGTTDVSGDDDTTTEDSTSTDEQTDPGSDDDGSTEPGTGWAPACTEVEACGGDYTGTWLIREGCMEFDPEESADGMGEDEEMCPGMTMDRGALVQGQVAFNEDGTYAADLQLVMEFVITVPGDCMDIFPSEEPLTCRDLGNMMAEGFNEEGDDTATDGSDEGMDSPDIDSDNNAEQEPIVVNCEDTADGGCSCSGSQESESISEIGTHALVDGFIRGTSSEDSDEGPNFRYCRDGDVLEVNHVDPSTDMSLVHMVMDLQ